jgi:galactokinase
MSPLRQEAVVRAPGRVNLMGDHTDYADGFALPLAIDLETRVAFRPATDGRVRMRSTAFEGAVDVPADGGVDPRTVDPPWGRLVAGVVRTLSTRGRPPVGLDAMVTSTVPPGSGLSSSAALGVSTALALLDVAAWALPPTEIAIACQEAEHLGTGVPSGIMDQLTSIRGVAGHALLLDCRTLSVEPVPLPSAYAIVVVHSGLPRALAESAYAQRHAAVAAAAARLGLDALRHEPVELGAVGARLTGAGFGGCVVAVVQRNHADDLTAKVTSAYRRELMLEPRAFVVRAADGAGPA